MFNLKLNLLNFLNFIYSLNQQLFNIIFIKFIKQNRHQLIILNLKFFLFFLQYHILD